MQSILSKIILAVCLFCLASFLALYLYQTGDFTRQGYLVKELQELKRMRLEEKSAIEQQFREVSLDEREEQIKQLGFVPVEQIKFIPVSSAYLTRSNP